MDFHVISNHLFANNSYCFSDPIKAIYGDFPKCPVCEHPTGSRVWLEPKVVKLCQKILVDFIFGSVFPFLLSKRAFELISGSDLKGIVGFERIKVLKKSSLEIYLPEISRGELLIDEKKSKFKRDNVDVCHHCKLGGIVSGFNGLFPIDATWDGKDIFFVRQLPGDIFVSDNFIDFIKKNKMTNIETTPMKSFRRREDI